MGRPRTKPEKITNDVSSLCDLVNKKYNLKPGIEFGKKLHEERVKWLKNNID